MDSIDLIFIGILVCSTLIYVLWVTEEIDYGEIKKWFGWKLTAERARKMSIKKERVKEEKEFEKVLGEILWISKEIGERQLKHAEFDERYVETLRQLGYEVEEESEPHDITGVRGYRIKW